jgi:membrane protease YdiL (CAAX protease family)
MEVARYYGGVASEPNTLETRERSWLDELATNRPDIPYLVPFMAFLLLLPLNDWLPFSWRPVAIAVRGGVSMWLAWRFFRHLPPLGKPHWFIAITVGLLVAWGWAAGQHFFDGIHIGDRSMGGRLIFFSGQPKADDPRVLYGPVSDFSWWSQVVLRILVSCTVVAIVEEVFWRGFMLRAFIDWDRFYTVPLGAFTWFSFLGTSLISVLEHPDNWAVSILCWFVYNGLMIWKKSILCLIITHGVTNLALYIYVVWARDWLLW